MNTVAIFHSPFTSKFGIPRQSGVVEELEGTIELMPPYNHPDAVRGLDAFEYIWLIWQFSENDEGKGLLVRPPRLGGNDKIGVFASRSPFRPNRLGLSCVKLCSVEIDSNNVLIHVKGADLMDGTPIFDIKPYVAYSDSHKDAKGGFVDDNEWKQKLVEFCDECKLVFTDIQLNTLEKILAQDPRPRFHNDENRVYGMPYYDYDVKFKVSVDTITVTGVERLK